jgi:DAHP synthase ferredoxin-like domain
MLIITKKNAPEEALDAIKEYLIEHGFDLHQSTGADRTIIGVIGDTDSLDERELEALPGVSQVVRIRKDD